MGSTTRFPHNLTMGEVARLRRQLCPPSVSRVDLEDFINELHQLKYSDVKELLELSSQGE